jgi:tripartite-type tricarboxylate transporter receptor subunit TctC
VKKFLSVISVLLLIGTQQSRAEDSADNYPTQPIQLIVPSGTGGITDALARALGQKIGILLNATIVVQDKPGASGIIGTAFVARAKPDGYTILIGPPSHVVNPNTTKKLPFDTIKDFAAVSKIASLSEILLVPAGSNAKTMQDLIQEAKTEPNKLTYGTSGVGSFGDLCMLLFQSEAKIAMMHIPYESEPAVMAGLVRGDVQAAFISPNASLAMIRTGRVRAIAISDPNGIEALPDVPSVRQAGLPGFNVTAFNGIFVPAKTPKGIVEKLNKAINTALKDPALIKFFISQGVTPLGGSSETLQTAVETDIAEIGKALKAAGIEPT